MSWITRIELPANLALPQREAFASLAAGLATRFSFLGMEDWAVELGAGVKVLGVEREFHDLAAFGAADSAMQFYFGRKADAGAFGRLLAAGVEGIRVRSPRRQVKRDWMKEWRKHYKIQVIREGVRALAVVPAWKKAPARGLAVKIWPGQAFGTGTHATTRLCLRLLLRSGFSGGRVLDFGAGTGVLALAAARVSRGGFQGVAVESDPAALAQCAKNARLNRVRLRLNRKFPAGEFDLVFANVLAPVLLRFRGELAGALKPGGTLILSGLLAKETDAFWRDFSVGLGLRLVERLDEGDWAALRATK